LLSLFPLFAEFISSFWHVIFVEGAVTLLLLFVALLRRMPPGSEKLLWLVVVFFILMLHIHCLWRLFMWSCYWMW